MDALQVVALSLETALDETTTERAQARENGRYVSVSGMEVYRLTHPHHGDAYMILPIGGEVYILPIASQNA